MKNIEIGYALTPFQQTVLDLTKQFEESADVRYELFAYGQTKTAWKLSREEVEAFPNQFKLLNSATWIREAARGYFLYLEYFIGLIRGEHVSSLLLPEDIPRIATIEDLRSEWLRIPAFREAVEGLMTALEQTLDYFNIQLVCNLVRDGLYRTKHNDDKPSFTPELSWTQIKEELQALEDTVYCRAKTFYHVYCDKAHQSMMDVPGVDPSILRYFTFTQQQLMTIAAHNRGCYQVDPEKIVAMDPSQPEPVQQWKETAAGLIVPGTL